MSNPIIKIEVRDYGIITAELYPDKAPKTVENFLSLIDRNFFDGLIFHYGSHHGQGQRLFSVLHYARKRPSPGRRLRRLRQSHRRHRHR